MTRNHEQITVLNQKGDIKGCLHIYQTIFKIEPELEPDLRLPIGICFNQLGMTKEAKKSFERAIARVSRFCCIDVTHNNLGVRY